MKPSDLYRDLAEQQAHRLRDGQNTPERQRYDEADEQLRSRAGKVIDRFRNGDFDKYGIFGPDIEESNWDVRPASDEIMRVTKTVVSFRIPAPYDLVELIDPQNENDIFVKVTMGSHDLQISKDEGTTWTDPERCESLDILTEIEVEDLNDDDNFNVELRRLERLNYMYPVSLDSDDLIDSIGPNLKDHFRPADFMHKIEGLHGALDLAEEYLEPWN